MQRTVVALGLVGAMVLASTAAFAWGPWHGRGFGAQGFGPGYGPGPAVANLSQDQLTKIQKIQSDRYAEMAKVRAEMFAKQTDLRALYREPTLDQDKIAAKQKEIVALQAEMQKKGLAARTAVAEVLTPEQRAQLPAFGPEAGPGFGPGFGPGRGFGPGMGMGPRMGLGPRW